MNLKKIKNTQNGLARRSTTGGFTLIEILVVIGIIAILAGIVLVAINPARQFRQANNSQRTANVNAILNAIGQYMVDHKGALPSDIPSGNDSSDADEIASGSGDADLCADLVPKYIPALPADPTKDTQSVPASGDDCNDSYATGYEVYENSGRVTVLAPKTEDVDNGGTAPSEDYISVTR